MDAPKQIYREEANELLADLEEALIELEQKPAERDLIDRIFRAMHTIKGSGAMFGFDDIAAFTHTIETVYDLIREGKLSGDRRAHQPDLEGLRPDQSHARVHPKGRRRQPMERLPQSL